MTNRDREQRNKMKRREIQVWVRGKMEQRIKRGSGGAVDRQWEGEMEHGAVRQGRGRR